MTAPQPHSPPAGGAELGPERAGHLLFDSGLLGICIWGEGGRILEANQLYCDLVGLGPEECRGGALNWLDSTAPEQFWRDFSALEQILSTGACRPYEKELLNRRDGRRVPVLSAGARFSGREERGIGFAVDLTELKCAEETRREELDRQQQILIRQGRLAALGEMIGNLAHQWRQPLNTLALIVQELPWYYEHQQLTGDYLNASVTRAMGLINQMSRTIDAFRTFFESAEDKAAFRVSEVLAHCVSTLEPSLHQLRIAVEVHADPGICLYGSRSDFSQVLINLLVNAKDALLERGVACPRIEVRLFREGERSVLTVTDNAGGVPRDLLERVFDPYFTTKGPDRGTGIGLYMCKTIIEKNMNGTLNVRNVGQGAEFRIEV